MTIRKLIRSSQETSRGRSAEQSKSFRYGALRGEAVVHMLGVALALASAGFASNMIMDADRQPQFAGLEHLAIYSRPTTLSSRRVSRQPEIDYTPVGAISAEGATPNYTLLAATTDYAIIRGPLGTVRIGRGDVLMKLGRVISIERRAEGWVVVTEGGHTVHEETQHSR